MTVPDGPRWPSVVAALVALALGFGAAFALAAGHHRWDGPVLFVISRTHGVHRDDLLGIVPALAGLGLAGWILRRDRRR